LKAAVFAALTMLKQILLGLIAASALYTACLASTSDDPVPLATEGQETKPMTLRLKLNKKTLTATMIDNATTRDFVSLLPLTLTMKDLFGREKYGHLPRPISDQGKRTRSYAVGDLIYWSPGPDLAIYYRHDGEPIPPPGVILIGRLDTDVDALSVPGTVKLTIELIQ
jgi:hypothetical protein